MADLRVGDVVDAAVIEMATRVIDEFPAGKWGVLFMLPNQRTVIYLPILDGGFAQTGVKMLKTGSSIWESPWSASLFWKSPTERVYRLAYAGEAGSYEYEQHPEFSAMCWEIEKAANE